MVPRLQSIAPELLGNKKAQRGTHGFPWGGEIEEILLCELEVGVEKWELEKSGRTGCGQDGGEK